MVLGKDKIWVNRGAYTATCRTITSIICVYRNYSTHIEKPELGPCSFDFRLVHYMHAGGLVFPLFW